MYLTQFVKYRKYFVGTKIHFYQFKFRKIVLGTGKRIRDLLKLLILGAKMTKTDLQQQGLEIRASKLGLNLGEER